MGFGDGTSVGFGVGTGLGSRVGFGEGASEGFGVGTGDGSCDGFGVGTPVGFDGFGVGGSVGPGDGMYFVGAAVGAYGIAAADGPLEASVDDSFDGSDSEVLHAHFSFDAAFVSLATLSTLLSCISFWQDWTS